MQIDSEIRCGGDIPEAEHGRSAVIIALHDLHRNSRVLKQARTLHDAGFGVTVLGIVRRSTDELEQPTDFGRIVRVRTTNRLHAERVEGNGIAARPVSKSLSPLAGVRMFLGRMRENAMLAKTAVALDPDVIIASDLTAWAAGVWVKRRTGAPLVCDARDLVTDAGYSRPPTFDWLLRRLEGWAIRHADAVTTVAPLMAEVLENRHRPSGGVAVVYNGPYGCAGAPRDVASPLRVLFQGHFAPNRAIDVMIRTVASLNGDTLLTIQGFGELRGQLESLVDSIGAEGVVQFVEPCAPSEVVACAVTHDVGLFWTNADTLNLRSTVPIKVFDYMAAGLAVVSADLPGTRAVLDEAGCGLLLDSTSTDALTGALQSLVDNPDEVLRMKRNAVAACPRYSWDIQGARFLKVVESVMTGGSRG